MTDNGLLRFNRNLLFEFETDGTPEGSIVTAPFSGTVPGGGAIFSFDSKVVTPIPLVVDINAVQEGSGDPSPDNVRPIIGFSSINISANGKNFTNNPISQGYWRASDGGFSADNTWVSTDNFKVKAGVKYHISATFQTRWLGVIAFDFNGDFIGSIGEQASTPAHAVDFTVTTPVNCGYIAISIASPTFTQILPSEITDLLCELGEDKTAYVPYATPNEYEIDLSAAGTVYGGTLDVVSGKLTITHFSRIFDGTESYFYESSTRWGWLDNATTIPYAKTQERADGMCSHFIYGTNNVGGNCIAGTGSATGAYFFIGKAAIPSITSLNDFKTWVASQYADGTPVRICYELATPLPEIQLSPTEVETLIGINNIWSNGGDVYTAISTENVKYKIAGGA